VNAPDDGNRRLRRVDWRFLAGRPDPARAFTSASGALHDGLALVAGAVVAGPGQERCELAALRDPTAADLRNAATALVPGGTCYVEWSRPVPGGGRTIRARLRAAGLDGTTCYWAWPPARRAPALYWLPLDAPNAIRWFLRTRSRSGGRVVRAAAVARASAWRGLRRLGLLPEVAAIARKPGPVCAGETLPAALARMLEPVDRGEPVACLLLTGGRSALNKVVALVFVGSEAAPRLAVKLARIPEAERSLRREAAILRAIHAAGRLPGIPQVVATGSLAGRMTVAETVIEGEPLQDRLTRAVHAPLAEQVADFLAELATRSRRGASTRWRTEVAEQAIRVLTPEDRPRAAAVLARVGELPTVCEQRDCSPWNLLVQADGALGMLDWESAERDGVPGVDLVYYLAYAAFFVDGTIGSEAQSASYTAMLRPDSATGRVYARCVARYASRVGIDPSAFNSLRLLCWLIHARAAQLRDAGGTREAGFHLALARWELDRQAAPGPQGRAWAE
jgi:hypothetical protein